MKRSCNLSWEKQINETQRPMSHNSHPFIRLHNDQSMTEQIWQVQIVKGSNTFRLIVQIHIYSMWGCGDSVEKTMHFRGSKKHTWSGFAALIPWGYLSEPLNKDVCGLFNGMWCFNPQTCNVTPQTRETAESLWNVEAACLEGHLYHTNRTNLMGPEFLFHFFPYYKLSLLLSVHK